MILLIMRKQRSNYQTSPRKKSSKKLPGIILLSILIVLIFLFVQGDQGFLKYIQLQKEKRNLRQRIEELKKEHNELINEIDLLTNNYRYLEKIAREQHQMGKKGEKIYILKSPTN